MIEFNRHWSMILSRCTHTFAHTFPCLYTQLPVAFLTPPVVTVFLLQTALQFSRRKAKARSIYVLLCINSQRRSLPPAQEDIRQTNINAMFLPPLAPASHVWSQSLPLLFYSLRFFQSFIMHLTSVAAVVYLQGKMCVIECVH